MLRDFPWPNDNLMSPKFINVQKGCNLGTLINYGHPVCSAILHFCFLVYQHTLLPHLLPIIKLTKKIKGSSLLKPFTSLYRGRESNPHFI
jgi:hypothetical protein